MFKRNFQPISSSHNYNVAIQVLVFTCLHLQCRNTFIDRTKQGAKQGPDLLSR